MVKKIVISILLCLPLFARENPFFPSQGEIDIPMSSNQVQDVPELKRATLKLPSSARIIESITIKYKTLDGDIKEQTEVLQNSIDWHLPVFISQNMQTEDKKKSFSKHSHKNFHKILSLKYISLYENAKEMKVITKDKLMRHFIMVEPHRIVMDFKRDIDIRSHKSDINPNRRFISARIGNHTGYYRVVVELDGEYVYKISRIKDGYLVSIR